MATLTDPGDTGAGDNYVTGSAYQVPDVAVVGGYATPHSLTGNDADIIKLSDQGGSGGSSDQAQVPTSSPFTVTPSDIRDVESAVQSELNTQVADYETFKKLIKDTEGWIFLVQTPAAMIPHEQATPTGYTSLSSGYAPDSVTPDFTDPNPDQTQQIVDAQNSLLRTLADSYRLTGEMVALLNNAAQNYVHADKAVFDGGGNVDDPQASTPSTATLT